MIDLHGKIALVTGAAGGQGAAEAKTLHALGAKVALGDIDAERAAQVAREIDPAGDRAFAILHDVRSPESWAAAVSAIVARFGGLSVLVNNAAIGGRGSLDRLTLQDWNELIATNATSIFIGVK